MRGEWIEISSKAEKSHSASCLSPCGESGLKSHGLTSCGRGRASLPMRGEWIEICGRCAKWAAKRSLPMRGEWIEMSVRFPATTTGTCLSPCGESGLKFDPHVALIGVLHVSPHAGRVD